MRPPPTARRRARSPRTRTTRPPTWWPTSTTRTTTRPPMMSGSTSPRARPHPRPSTDRGAPMAFSKAMIIGNLGRDPEMRYTPSGRPVTESSVAVNQSTKNQQTGEWVEATDWFRVSVWGDRDERAAENLRKGNKVFVEGRFKTREFEGRDGQKRTSLELTADSLANLEKRNREEGDGEFSSTPPARPAGAAAGGGGGAPRGGGGGGFDDTSDLDDLPF